MFGFEQFFLKNQNNSSEWAQCPGAARELGTLPWPGCECAGFWSGEGHLQPRSGEPKPLSLIYSSGLRSPSSQPTSTPPQVPFLWASAPPGWAMRSNQGLFLGICMNPSKRGMQKGIEVVLEMWAEEHRGESGNHRTETAQRSPSSALSFVFSSFLFCSFFTLSFSFYSSCCAFHLNSYVKTQHIQFKNGTAPDNWSRGLLVSLSELPSIWPHGGQWGPSSDHWASQKQSGSFCHNPTPSFLTGGPKAQGGDGISESNMDFTIELCSTEPLLAS